MVEISGGSKVAGPTVAISVPSPTKPSQPSSFTQSTLASMGKTVGFGLFQALRFIAVRSVAWVSTFFGPETFLEPAGVAKAFEEDPFRALDKLLYLFDRNPDVCEKILLNLAEDWKKHPRKYLQYQKDSRQMRTNWVSGLDQLFEDLILTKAQRDFKKKIYEGELSDDEVCVTRDQDWKALKNPSREAKQARKLYLELQNLQKLKNELWDTCYAQYIVADWDRFADLNLNCEDEHLEKEEHISFGHFIERLMHVRDPRSLQQNDIFDEWASFLQSVLKRLTHDESQLLKKYPNIRTLVQRAQRILSDDTKVRRLQITISKLIGVYYPSGKISPLRKRASAC